MVDQDNRSQGVSPPQNILGKLPDTFPKFTKLPLDIQSQIWRLILPRVHVNIEVDYSNNPGMLYFPEMGNEDLPPGVTTSPKTIEPRAIGLDIVKHYSFLLSCQPEADINPVRWSINTKTGNAIGRLPYFDKDHHELEPLLQYMATDLSRGLDTILNLQLFEKRWNGRPWRLRLWDPRSRRDTHLGHLVRQFPSLRAIDFVVPNAQADAAMYSWNKTSAPLWEFAISRNWRCCQHYLKGHLIRTSSETEGNRAPRARILLGKEFFAKDMDTRRLMCDAPYDEVFVDCDCEKQGHVSCREPHLKEWIETNVRILDKDQSIYPTHMRSAFI